MYERSQRGLLTTCGILLPALLAFGGAPDIEVCSSPNAPISDTLPTVVDTIDLMADHEITDTEVSVDLTHTWVGDLNIDVVSPALTTVRLQDTDGGNTDDIDVIYSDSGIANGPPYACGGCLMQPSGPGVLSDLDGQSSLGTWTLIVDDSVAQDDGVLNTWCMRIYGDPAAAFIRGDVDGDGFFNGLLDGVAALNYQFVPGSATPPCMDAADADNSGVFNGIIDASLILNWQFVPGSAPPPAPFPGCGVDDDGALGCAAPPAGCNP